MFSAEMTFGLAFGVLIAGALITFAAGRQGIWRPAGILAAVASIISAAACWMIAYQSFTRGPIIIGVKQISIASLHSSLAFRIDELSGLFLALMPIIGLCSVCYSIGYMPKRYPNESPRRFYPAALILLASMIGIVAVNDLFFFLVFWEIMTLTSYLVIIFDRGHAEKVNAGLLYFVVMHFTAAGMIIAQILTFGKSKSYAFDDVASGLAVMSSTAPWLMHIVLALFFIAFATKAGMFPLGGWLPDAHAAAPSPVSAMLSGIIVKLGIYGIVRVFLSFLEPSTATTIWGYAIATLGASSIFVGTVTALRQDDGKRVLGFHTIGQIGYILLGVGIGIAFIRTSPAVAAVGLIGGLFHMVNHALFKSLLFLNVGAAEYWTGERNLNRLGGLGALMPYTLTAAIVASMSIAGMPPMNGFVSKWLIYQAAFRGGLAMPLFLVLGLVGMFVSLVTLASFMKLLGAVFLGKPAKTSSEVKGDVPQTMRMPQFLLSAGCIVLGIMPILPILPLYRAAAGSMPFRELPAFSSLFGSEPSGIALTFGDGTVGIWNPLVAAAALLLCTALAYMVLRSALAPTRHVESWYCGERFDAELVRYRSHGFCQPFKQAFEKVYPSLKLPKWRVPAALQKFFDVDSWLYQPAIRTGAKFSEVFSHTHVGIPQMYMLWQIAGVALVVIILFLIVK